MTNGAVTSPQAKVWDPLRHRMFRWLWLAQLGSGIGVWMQTVGAQWFLVKQANSPALVAWVQSASLLPALLLSLLAGVLADQYDRRLLLVGTNAAATLIAGVLALLAYLGDLTPVSLLALTFMLGCTSALMGPAWQAIQPDLVPRSELSQASALGGVTVNVARAVGPAIAGVLVAVTGPASVFLLNALSFVLVILAVWAWKPPPRPASLGDERLSWSMTDGLRYVFNGPIVRRILLRSALFAFPASALWALLPDAASETLKLDSSGYGMLLGTLGVGALAGVGAMSYWRAHVPQNILLAVSALVFAIGTVSVVWWPIAVVMPILFLTGMAWIASVTTLNADMQLTLPPWVRARGLAAYLVVFMGAQAIGSFLFGAMSDSLGTANTLAVAAAALVICAGTLAIWPLHSQTGTLDRSIISWCLPSPSLSFDPEPTDGPVLVTRKYSVEAEKVADFVAAMHRVEETQRRTGATSWKLLRNGEKPGEFTEQFTLRSWAQFQNQATTRWTGYDYEGWQNAVRLAMSPPSEDHYFAVSTHKSKEAPKPRGSHNRDRHLRKDHHK